MNNLNLKRSELEKRYWPSGSGRPGPGLAASVGCSQDKPMLLISSSHEKRTAVKLRASRNREFYVMNRNEESSLPGIITSVPSICRQSSEG